MSSPKLFMLLIGCRPAGRHTEQHDVFFTIGHQIKDLIPAIKIFWPEAKNTMHLDAWREVKQVGDYDVTIIPKQSGAKQVSAIKLFFINLGGYKPDEFDEFHYKILLASTDKAAAIKESKQTAFYKHTCFKGAPSHVDDKYGVDVDDLFEIEDILPANVKETYQLVLTPAIIKQEDNLHLGYFRCDKL